MSKITFEILHEFLTYDPFTGDMYWKFRDRKWFESDRVWKLWNTKFSGKQAFTSIGSHGYYNSHVLNESWLKHRAIWLMCFGELPKIIDHENGNKLDCRLINLRKTDHVGNSKNRGFNNNSSGRMGVYWDKKRNKWRATIRTNNSNKHLGYFNDLDEAIIIRINAERKYDFHLNHGRIIQ